MRARLYHPGLGRFTSPDPWPAYLPEPVTLHRYLYALGDPISQVDPLGLFCWTGKKDGKCRGLHDVAARLSQPLSNAATAVSAVAVISAGVVVLCPPCGIAGLSALAVSEVAGTAALATGWASAGVTCLAAGTVKDFDCAVKVATGTLARPVRDVTRAAGPALGFAEHAVLLESGAIYKQVATFATRIFGLFVKGATSASRTWRAEK